MTESAATNSIRQSISKGELVVVVGTGCSISVTNNYYKSLSWSGLIKSGFDFAGVKGKVSSEQIGFWSNQLHSSDIDDVLSAAEYISRKLNAPTGDLYARWLNESFENITPKNNDMIRAINHISSMGIPICTLNYDSLLESVTNLPTIVLSDTRKSSAWIRGEEKGILHLHGHWQQPETCILGIRDYEKTLDSETRDLFQRYLGAFKRLLFIGCGDTFSDPNFSALIMWLRSNMGASTPQHYALVDEKQLPERHADLTWQGFVDPLGYGSSHSDLPNFLCDMFSQVTSPKNARTPTIKKASRSDKNAKLLNSYKEFLVRDCGQMTIEGVRADMDTAQRRFDLERLFVPLDLLPCPPDISLDDPERQKKLTIWKRKNKDAQSFGKIFSKTKGLALLALPGGGKSLLLKRLAVAYASPDRRLKSDDHLPNIEITPVLIRCREWREHITLPIATLLKSLPDITGQPGLEGLSGALTPLFRQGKVLLLVDGLDEIHDDADRTIFVENLRGFLDQFPKTKLVVTSREAGFNLVAPYLATYCEQWRVASLSSDAIRLLCGHWHKLMVGNAPEAIQEAESLGTVLTSNVALRRLAENPLLLTMLLVVKHGAGRLPPDRVSLYGRAVEVLLDTWNIKGHDALNMKEAIPQLSYIAYELMQAGQQTATERELLELLEKARENVPQIKRYAKDTPYEFLKRVELRSSLLLEAGHQVENGRAVPFYQFRHLTFQEYLAALAVVEGNYVGYDAKTPILKPLNDKLASDEWKEVIPMTAVLAGKQGESVVQALVKKGILLKRKMDEGKGFAGKQEWISHPNVLPSVIARLVQSLIEEAQAEPRTLAEALKLIAYFARGCQSSMDWKTLCRGPYAGELINQAWKLYEPMDFPAEAWVRNSYASFAAHRKPTTYWLSEEGQDELHELLSSSSDEKICLGLMTCVGILWNGKSTRGTFTVVGTKLSQSTESFLFSDNPAIAHVALWVWSLDRHSNGSAEIPPVKILNLLLEGFMRGDFEESDLSAFALDTCFGLSRDYWKPKLTFAYIEKLRTAPKIQADERVNKNLSAVLVIAFHALSVLSDAEIVVQISALREHYKRISIGRNISEFDRTLAQIQPYGVDYLASVVDDDDVEVEDELYIDDIENAEGIVELTAKEME
ncbi:NACHT domain-containing protein [Pseudomonas cavernicola]|uniref:NACHT domain-containing protein n=1 Tax=Pseudomonas cavernicola TaxID=2320866 RepID=A0A418XIP2_9PSED|nr:SIR2 family protein [Pseudomonas cavernicola]RJG12307.1 NACHT domain-containing protein [Pseudomonas cavernicola]